MSGYTMTLTLPGGKTLGIPVLPEKVEVSCPGKNETATVLGLGEVLLLRNRGLKSIQWESHLPAAWYPSVTGKAVEPIAFIRAIEEARGAKQPLELLLTGTDLAINMAVGVEDFSYDERGGEVGDLYYSITLSEWRKYGPRKITLSKGGGTETEKERTGTPETAAKQYTVVRGDSLWAIAKRQYGNGGKWPTIYNANKAVIGSNPNRIYPGQVLTIP